VKTNSDWRVIDDPKYCFVGSIFSGSKRWTRKTTRALPFFPEGEKTIAQGRANRSAAKAGAALGWQATAQSSEG